MFLEGCPVSLQAFFSLEDETELGFLCKGFIEEVCSWVEPIRGEGGWEGGEGVRQILYGFN